MKIHNYIVITKLMAYIKKILKVNIMKFANKHIMELNYAIIIKFQKSDVIQMILFEFIIPIEIQTIIKIKNKNM